MSSQHTTEPAFAQVIEELRAIRSLLSAVLEHRAEESALADTKAEIAMVQAAGIDPVEYLKRRARSSEQPARKNTLKEIGR